MQRNRQSVYKRDLLVVADLAGLGGQFDRLTHIPGVRTGKRSQAGSKVIQPSSVIIALNAIVRRSADCLAGELNELRGAIVTFEVPIAVGEKQQLISAS